MNHRPKSRHSLAVNCTPGPNLCFTQLFRGKYNSFLLSPKSGNKKEKGVWLAPSFDFNSIDKMRWDDWAKTSEKRIRSYEAARVNEANGAKCRICFYILFQAGIFHFSSQACLPFHFKPSKHLFPFKKIRRKNQILSDRCTTATQAGSNTCSLQNTKPLIPWVPCNGAQLITHSAAWAQ